MGNYSKLIGAIVGGVVGILAAKNFLPADWTTPDIQNAVVVLLSAVATYFFPANQPSK